MSKIIDFDRVSYFPPQKESGPSYFSVGRNGGTWAVFLETPSPGSSLSTILARFPTRDEAVAHAKSAAAAMKGMPFKPRGARQ